MTAILPVATTLKPRTCCGCMDTIDTGSLVGVNNVWNGRYSNTVECLKCQTPNPEREKMATVAKDEGGFEKAPEGQHAVVCCDVQDLGIVESTWNGKVKRQPKIRVWFQLGDTDSKGVRFLISRMLTLSLGDRANLRKFLESWRGKKYTAEEAQAGVDVEKMVDVPALIQVVHNDRGYADIDSIMRVPKGMDAPKVEDFVRFKDRTEEAPQDGPPHPAEGPDPDDDDLPF